MTSSNGLVGQVEKLVAAELEKRRKGGGAPDSGMDVTAWNAANPQHPKDARGRWSDNPAGRAIAEAYSRVKSTYGNDWARLADVREEVGGQFTRAEVDAELKRLAVTPGVHLIPWDNKNALQPRDHAAALRFGGEESHALRIEGDLPAPAKKHESWSDNPAGHAIAQAYSNLRAAPGRDPGAEWVSLASLREEVGTSLSRADLDDELKRLDRASVINLVPENNQKTLTEAQRAAGLRMGGQDKHLVSFMGGDLPAPSKKHEDFLPGLADSPFSPGAEPWRAYRANLTRQLTESNSGLSEWDDDELERAQKAAMEFSRAAEMELFRRKGDALNPPKAPKPRATARLTAKPPKDLSGVADRLRHAPTTEAAQEQLDGLTVADLRAVAAEADVPLTSKMTKQQIKDRLIKQLDGSERTTRSLFPSMESKPQKPATARLTNKPSSDDALAQRLAREGITRAEVEKELEGLKLAELKALAKTLRQQLGTVSTSGTRKDQIKGDILEGLVGFKERARAIFEGSTAGSFDDRFSVVQGGKA